MRICNGCNLCCHATAITDLEKNRHTSCVHQCAEGCAIHQVKPYVCATVNCLWLDGYFIETDWPASSGFAALDKGEFYIGYRHTMAVVHEDSRHTITEEQRVAFVAKVHQAGWPIVLLNSHTSENMIVYIDVSAPGIMTLVFNLEQGGSKVIRMTTLAIVS